jgi:phosphotriesterase-related protein
MSINTVTGEINSAQLGYTLAHEHLVTMWDGALLDSTLHVDWPAIERTLVEKVKAAKAVGYRSIIDMSTIEMGRNVEMMRRVSEQTEVNIVCISGLFAEAFGIPYHFRQMSDDELTRFFVTEVSVGIGKTGIRAGALKIATGGVQATPLEERLARVVARAQRETGVPILTHTGRGGGGLRQIELLTEGGVPETQIVIGHCDVSSDLRYHQRLLKRGVCIGFDRIGMLAFNSDEVRAHCIKALVDLGHRDRLIMSMDAHGAWIGHETPGLTEGDRDYLHLERKFFPLLRKVGVSDDDIRHIMVENPRGLFEPRVRS